jgi:hypothetical protein
MADKYRITADDSEFVINHDTGGNVSVWKTVQEAQQEIEVCEHDDLMLDTARSLVKKAVEEYMRMHDIDRQAAHSWIREAAG